MAAGRVVWRPVLLWGAGGGRGRVEPASPAPHGDGRTVLPRAQRPGRLEHTPLSDWEGAFQCGGMTVPLVFKKWHTRVYLRTRVPCVPGCRKGHTGPGPSPLGAPEGTGVLRALSLQPAPPAPPEKGLHKAND